jgi:hypothetical protein
VGFGTNQVGGRPGWAFRREIGYVLFFWENSALVECQGAKMRSSGRRRDSATSVPNLLRYP